MGSADRWRTSATGGAVRGRTARRLDRGQAGQTDNATGRVESDGGAELYTEAVGEFTQDALGAEH